MGPIRPGRIAISNVLPAVEASREAGLPEDGLRGLGLVGDARSVSGAVTYAHFEWAESLLGEADFARFLVDAARRHRMDSLGVVGIACRAAPTVGDALSRHARFQHLTNRTAQYVLDVCGDEAALIETRPGPPRRGALLMSDYTLLVAAHLFREVGVEPRLREARSRRSCIPEPQRTVLEGALGVPWSCGHARASLHFDAGVLGHRPAHADDELSGFLLARLRSVPAPRPSIVERVAEALREAWATGADSGADAVAKSEGLSRRTLQRRLAEGGTTFARVRAQTRVALAEGYLTDPEITLIEVAYLLGYTDETSFWRAFRRETGSTPAARRAALLGA